MTSTDGIVDDVPNRRFVYRDGSDEAELVYRRSGRRFVITHTGVPEALGGRGLGGQLVARAVEQAGVEGLTVVPVCPFARQWLEQHPDTAAQLSIAWPADGREGG